MGEQLETYVKTFKHTPRGCRGECYTSLSAGKHAHQSVSLPGAVRSDVAARVILCVRDDRDVNRAFVFCSLDKTKKCAQFSSQSFPYFVYLPQVFASRVEIYPPDSGEKDKY